MKKFIGSIGMAQLASIAGAIISGISIVYLSESVNNGEPHDIVENVESDTIYSEELTTEIIGEPTGDAIPDTTLIVEITSDTETTTVFETMTKSVDTTTQNETEKKTEAETTTAKKKTEKTTTAKPAENSTKYANADISSWINPSGNTVETRFKTPDNFTRMVYEKGSYADYVRSLPLEYYGRKMYEYNGKLVENQSWCASVIRTEFHSRGWLQCADCVMKLLGDYLYENGRSNEIVFQLASGERLKYSSWTAGDYDKYMTEVYYSANTSSLKSQSESVKLSLKNIFPGAYFIMDKDSKHEYGHAVFVIDVAKNEKTGEIAFLLAQGSTPSQDMNIFLNPLHPDDPWYYSSEIGNTFNIPFWTFKTSNLYYYKPIGIQKGVLEEETTIPEETAGTNGSGADAQETTVDKEISTNEEQTTTVIEEGTTTVIEEETTTIIVEETTTTEENSIIDKDTGESGNEHESEKEEETTTQPEPSSTNESVSVR